MASKSKTTESERKIMELIESVMSQPVPKRMELTNPLNKKKRKMSVDGGSGERPEDPSIWTTRHLVDYFAEKYYEAFGKNYRKTYRSDQHAFQQLFGFLASNGLDKAAWAKRLIDWGFENYERIVRKEKYVTPQTLLRMVNFFIQEEVMPLVEEDKISRDSHDSSLLDEIAEAETAGKRMEIFSRHGIPVAITYLTRCRGYSVEEVLPSFKKFLDTLSKTAEGRTRIKRMVMASVLGSPYPREFAMLDWREEFGAYCKVLEGEQWWREVDYAGKPLAKYYALLTGGCK
jgi:hypothetical protein